MGGSDQFPSFFVVTFNFRIEKREKMKMKRGGEEEISAVGLNFLCRQAQWGF